MMASPPANMPSMTSPLDERFWGARGRTGGVIVATAGPFCLTYYAKSWHS